MKPGLRPYGNIHATFTLAWAGNNFMPPPARCYSSLPQLLAWYG